MLSARPALPRARTSLLTRLGTIVAGLTLAVGTVVTAAPAAHAAPTSDSTTQHMTARQRFAAKADRVLHVARNQKGDPYRYGAAGPNAFDCSGLVYYTFRRALGRTLPRTAQAQKQGSRRIWHRRNLRPGDLVFETTSSGYAFHVGIYAGHGYIWHAPHSGTVVHKQKMWHARWRYGRYIRS